MARAALVVGPATSPILAFDGSAAPYVDVTNTLVETTIYSLTIPPGTLVTAGNAIEVQLDGDYLHNVASSDSMKVKLNGVTLIDLGATEFANSANRRKWVANIIVQSLGAASQLGRVLAGMSDGTLTDGKFVNGSPAAARSMTLGTQDANASMTLTVTWQSGVASTSVSLRRFGSLARRLA